MSSGLTPSFRLPISIPDSVHPAVREALTTHDQGLVVLNQAIKALSAKVTAGTTSTSTTTTEQVSSETVVESSSTAGGVNNQTGVTAYTTQSSDNGGLIVLNDASAIAVTLSVTAGGISTPWYCRMMNTGSGTATLTPVSGTVNYGTTLAAASYSLTSGNSIWVYFDGTNFWLT